MNKEQLEQKKKDAWEKYEINCKYSSLKNLFDLAFDAGIEAMKDEFNRMDNYYLIAKQKELEIESLKAEIEARLKDVVFWKTNAEHFDQCSRGKDHVIMNLDEEISKRDDLLRECLCYLEPDRFPITRERIKKFLKEKGNETI
jgi:flagellar biosynthesis/type III secretory pathway protein FliH